jgi:hypothetical protein
MNSPGNIVQNENEMNYQVMKRIPWRNLTCILLNEGTQSEKTTYCTIPTLWHSGKSKTIKTVKILWFPRAQRQGRMSKWSGGNF